MGAGERTPRPPANRAFVRGLALVGVAVVIAVALLAETPPSDLAADARPSGTTTTVDRERVRSTTTTTEAAEPKLREPDEYTVVVANGSGVGGAASRFSQLVADGGFQLAAPTNAEPVDATVVWFAEGFDDEAAAVAARLGPVPPQQPMPEPLPVEEVGGAAVVVVIGPDLAREG